jgi:hypothetical protein
LREAALEAGVWPAGFAQYTEEAGSILEIRDTLGSKKEKEILPPIHNILR